MNVTIAVEEQQLRGLRQLAIRESARGITSTKPQHTNTVGNPMPTLRGCGAAFDPADRHIWTLMPRLPL
jgi:hypothetical protein